MKTMNQLIESVNNEIISKNDNIWVGSPFEFLQSLSADQRGKWGESLLYSLIKKTENFNVTWYGDSNTSHSDGSIFDMMIENFRTETKTATKGSKVDLWQHDNLYEEHKWDKVVFIDVDLYGIYFTVQNHSDIPFKDDKHKILNKKSTRHLSAWKFDLTRNQLSRLKENKVTFFYDWNNPNEDGLMEFLNVSFFG